jgi:aldose 1-epimerase
MPLIERGVVGTAPARGRHPAAEVESYRLDSHDGLAVEVWTYGATLVEVRTPDRDGRVANVCVRLPDLPAYLDRATNPYVGATIGRFCRSVAGGEFELDGVRHTLDRNDGRHQVHGGPVGLDRYVWSAEAGHDGDAVELRLSATSPSGDQGYPGELSVSTTYRVEPGGVLAFEHTARTTEATVVSLTNHAFWNLAGHGVIDDHHLRVNAVDVVRFDRDLIPLPGGHADVRGTPLDFRAPQRIGQRRVDNCFVLGDQGWTAELSHPDSGRMLRLRTDQPAVGVYTGDWFTQRPRCGICLETGALPDAPNRSDYPSARLDPGRTYRHRAVHQFFVSSRSAP